MINIRDCEILDLLPYTFKTPRITAMSKAIAALTKKFYDMCSALLFWGNIDKASPILLDAMAAELDCPFYSSDMPDAQKRSIIKSAFRYNASIGTVSSVTGLLAGAFGSGKVSEWYEYGGAPYYFKAIVESSPPLSITKDGYELFANKFQEVIPRRAKLQQIIFRRSVTVGIYTGVGIVKRYKKFTVPAGTTPDMERGYN